MTNALRILVIELAIVAGLLGACANGPRDAAPPPADPANTPAVVLPSGVTIAVEVVSDPETRAAGLMHRPSLAADRGMLFLFPQTGFYPFWMKNTLIPLDMIWIGEDLRIVDIRANVPPCPGDPCPSFEPRGAARYVLELAAGQAAARGLEPGDELRFLGTEQYIVR